jgi:hypothetical protein
MSYRSRILELFSKEILEELSAITNKRTLTNNNEKIQLVEGILKKHKVDYLMLGSGTNRTAILINGYVYKIALDKYGIKDNDSEFALSLELQPWVIKTYETNGLISVCEYVQLITNKSEFEQHKYDILSILHKITERNYLVGDVGFNSKNFCNWGKRIGSNELCILDFAYIYRIRNEVDIICYKCEKGAIVYDDKYVNLHCEHCNTSMSFNEARRCLVSEDDEDEFIYSAKKNAIKMTEPLLSTVTKKREESKKMYRNVEEERDEQIAVPERFKGRASIFEEIDIDRGIYHVDSVGSFESLLEELHGGADTEEDWGPGFYAPNNSFKQNNQNQNRPLVNKANVQKHETPKINNNYVKLEIIVRNAHNEIVYVADQNFNINGKNVTVEQVVTNVKKIASGQVDVMRTHELKAANQNVEKTPVQKVPVNKLPDVEDTVETGNSIIDSAKKVYHDTFGIKMQDFDSSNKEKLDENANETKHPEVNRPPVTENESIDDQEDVEDIDDGDDEEEVDETIDVDSLNALDAQLESYSKEATGISAREENFINDIKKMNENTDNVIKEMSMSFKPRINPSDPYVGNLKK